MGSALHSQGLTPQQAIVNKDGTPTTFFFRWLLSSKAAQLVAGDLELLETFTDGALDAALTEALAAAGEAALAASVTEGGAAAIAGELRQGFRELEAGAPFIAPPGRLGVEDLDGDRYTLEPLIWLPAPVETPTPARGLLASIPTGLNQGDAGRTYYATDFQHKYRWTGAAWAYDDGELGSGFIEWFMVAPRAGAWQLCNGAAGVNESRADGTAGLVAIPGLAAGTVPDLITANVYIRGAAAANGAVTAATGPTFAGGSTTGAANLAPSSSAGGSGGGAFITGFTNPHAHSIPAFATVGEPAHIDALPYYRL